MVMAQRCAARTPVRNSIRNAGLRGENRFAVVSRVSKRPSTSGHLCRLVRRLEGGQPLVAVTAVLENAHECHPSPRIDVRYSASVIVDRSSAPGVDIYLLWR